MQNFSSPSAEWAFACQFAQSLPPEALGRWHACRSGHTFQAFFSKQVVAFTIEDGVPKILKVLVCEDLLVNLRKGTSSLWIDQDTGEEVSIGHTPVEVAPSCFMWHLQHTTLDLNEHRGRYNVKFNLAYRTSLNPATRESGAVYLLEYATFRHQYTEAL